MAQILILHLALWKQNLIKMFIRKKTAKCPEYWWQMFRYVSWLLHSWRAISCTSWCSSMTCRLINHPNDYRILSISTRRIFALLGGLWWKSRGPGVVPSLQPISFLLRSLGFPHFRARIPGSDNVVVLAALAYLSCTKQNAPIRTNNTQSKIATHHHPIIL